MTSLKTRLPHGGPLNYTLITRFEWDHEKSDRCFAERGFEYGEERYQIIGLISHMKITRHIIRPGKVSGRIDAGRVDNTSEEEILAQEQVDDAEALREAGQDIRAIRRRLGLSQTEFSRCIDVSVETIRNWEQGKRSPTGAAKALLKILDKAPDVALKVLG